MSRVQLALNVTDLESAIGFYSKLFGAEPAKVRPGYANFAIADPPLKLVLIEGKGAGGTLNHLGVEVASTEEVGAAQSRLTGAGLVTAVEDEVTCCYAVQDKVWVDGPDAEPWEIYTVLADAEMPAGQLRGAEPGSCGPGACCDTTPAVQASACCDTTAAVQPSADTTAVPASADTTTVHASADTTAVPASADTTTVHASASRDQRVGA